MGGMFAQESSPRIVSATGVVITGLNPNTQYTIEVQAVNRCGHGPLMLLLLLLLLVVLVLVTRPASAGNAGASEQVAS